MGQNKFYCFLQPGVVWFEKTIIYQRENSQVSLSGVKQENKSFLVDRQLATLWLLRGKAAPASTRQLCGRASQSAQLWIQETSGMGRAGGVGGGVHTESKDN